MRGLNYSTPVKQCNCLHHSDDENLEKRWYFIPKQFMKDTKH